jgi:hypothetical protein
LVGSLGLARAGTRDFYPALIALVSQVQNNLFLGVYTFSIYASPSIQATLAGSRAGPPVSECVSTVSSGGTKEE